MIPILAGSAFTFAFGLPILHRLARRRISPRAIQSAALVAIVLTVVAIANFELGFIPQKVASQQAFLAYSRRDLDSTFTVQALLNVGPFTITGVWWAAIGTNVALVALTYAFVYDEDRRLARRLLAPAVLNFAIFSLRDPLLGVLLFALVLVMFGDRRPSPRRLVAEGLLAFAIFLTRPEFIAVYIAGKVIGQRLDRRRSWKIALIPLALPVVLYALTWLPTLLGLQNQVPLAALPDLLNDFFVTRADRADDPDGGGGSNILDGRLASMPLVARLPIQLLTFFVLPLPFEISSITLALAFVDSLVFIVLFREFWRRADSRVRRFFVLYFVAIAFFVANYGNLFRLRMPAYFVMIAGLVLVERRRRSTERALEIETQTEVTGG